MKAITTRRLDQSDRELARSLFLLMAQVFAEQAEPLSDAYLEQLLGRADFWVIAAFVDKDLVGGITGHTLLLTSVEKAELFVYDLAVREDQQRQGIGRQLVHALCAAATAVGINTVIIPVDNDDLHALEFYRAIGGQPSPVTIFSFTQA